MATTLNIQRFIRSVRQGRTSAPVSCTAMSACTQQAYDALLADSWTRVEERESGLPRHNWAQTGFSNRWDAAKYCGDYAEGFQHGYATAVCYTIRMPADALAGTAAKIASLAIPVRGDRWLADGCDIGVTLSASAVPTAWDAPPDDTVTGQLAVVPSNTGVDTSAIVTFDWSAAPKTSLAYLHIALRLTDYLTHRGAWIEGGAMIDGANIAIAFDREVTPDTETTFDDPADSLIVPIRLYAADTNRTPIAYTGVNVNLASTYLRRHWTVDMLRGGQGSVGTADSVTALTPMLTADGLSMTAQGHIAKAWCPVAAVAGATLWLRAVGSAWPAHSTIRVSVFTGADMPPATSPATWAGEGDACIGTRLITGAAEGDTLGVPLSRNGASPLWIVCGFERISAEDSSLGAADTGISLLDAHISPQPVGTDVMPHFLMIGPASGAPIGLMRDPSGSSAGVLPLAYAMQRNSYVARNAGSFAWLNPGDVSDEVLEAGIVASGTINSDFAATVSMGGILRLATNGTLPAALTALEGDSGYYGVAPLALQCLATLKTTGVVAAVSGPIPPAVALAAAINGASVADGVAIRGYGTALLIQTAATVQAAGTGLNGAFVSAVAALSGIRAFHGMAIGNVWACFVKTDGTAVALSLADGSADATVATWTGVTAIATAYNAIVAINSSGALLVANGAAYAGLDSTSISALNDLYTFSGVIANIDTLHATPEFALAVSGLA